MPIWSSLLLWITSVELNVTINCQYGVENYNESELPVWSGYLQWNSVPVSSRELLYNGFECWAKFIIHFSRQHYEAWSHFSLQTKSLFRTKCLVWAIQYIHITYVPHACCSGRMKCILHNLHRHFENKRFTQYSTVQYSTVQ